MTYTTRLVALAVLVSAVAGMFGYRLAGSEAAFSDVGTASGAITVGQISTSPPIPAECASLEDPDIITLTEGDDVYNAGHGNHIIFGLGGNDTIDGGSGDDCIIGGPGNDTLSGGSGDDFLFGNEGDDSLFGNEGDDYLDGGPHESGDYCDAGGSDDDEPVIDCEDGPALSLSSAVTTTASEPECEADGASPLSWWSDDGCDASEIPGTLADLFNAFFGPPDAEPGTVPQPATESDSDALGPESQPDAVGGPEVSEAQDHPTTPATEGQPGGTEVMPGEPGLEIQPGVPDEPEEPEVRRDASAPRAIVRPGEPSTTPAADGGPVEAPAASPAEPPGEPIEAEGSPDASGDGHPPPDPSPEADPSPSTPDSDAPEGA